MVTVDDVQRLLLAGADVVGPDGRKIGSVGQLFLDAESGDPAWVTVATGLFGRGESFVPLAGAVAGEHELRVGYDKDQVKHAPRIASSDGTLSPDEERDLFRHYGLGGHGPDDDPPGDRLGDHDPHDDAHDDGHDDGHDDRHDERAGDTSGEAAGDRLGDDRGADAPPAASPPDDGMVLRAERAAVVGTERVPTERVRLRRYTVTENRTISVPVSREEYRIEDDVDAAQPPRAPGDEPQDRPGDGHEGRQGGPRHRR